MKTAIVSGLLLALLSSPAIGGWTLDGDDSSLEFVSTKANAAAEVHQFRKMSGHVDDKGMAIIAIDLASVDTAVEIRDQRMREVLFETDSYPSATLKAHIDADRVAALDSGAHTKLAAEAILSLRDTELSLMVELEVARLSPGRLMVTGARPVIVNAGQLDLAAGVEKLREIAGLPSISPAVPVTFTLFFDSE